MTKNEDEIIRHTMKRIAKHHKDVQDLLDNMYRELNYVEEEH